MELLGMSNAPLSRNYMALLASDSQRHPGMMTQPLLNFMATENPGPWTPVAFSGDGGQGGSAVVPANGYQNYRNPTPMSAPSDSGYASRRYIDEISSLGEAPFDPSLQDISNQFGTVTFDQPNSRKPPPSAYSAPGTSSGPELRCETCGESVKTKSAMKKHVDRHNKPHVCKEPGCTRSGGFGTHNDLVRHQRSSHKSLSVPGKQYTCNLGQCSARFKIWPRGDNFRCHLKSVHGVSEEETKSRPYLDQFLYQSVPENDTNLLQGIGGGTGLHDFPTTLADDWPVDSSPWNTVPLDETPMMGGNDQKMAEFEEMQLEYVGRAAGSSISTPPLRRPDLPPQIQKTLDNLSENCREKPMGATETASTIAPQQLAYRDLVRQEQESSGRHPTRGSGEEANFTSMPDAASTPQASPRVEDNTCNASVSSSPDSSATPHGSTEMEFDDTMAVEDEDRKEGNFMKVLEGIPEDFIQRYLREKGIVIPAADGGADRDDSGTTKQKHRCTWEDCNRGFNRRSELNKHVRRHNKPYGCTFPRCSSKFGSKSDWRRHENSQHFQLEMWKCDEQVADGSICTKACQRRDVFENHLKSDHRVEDREEIEARQERCRVDRNSSTRFWCGFCMDVVEIPSGSSRGVCSERYDHIGNHFTGGNSYKKQNIADWVSGDPGSSDAKLGDVSLRGMDLAKQPGEKRKREGSVEDEEGARPAKKVSGRRL